MPRTISEAIFDGLCVSRGITCLLVAEGEGRTPDRELVFGTERVIVEVKEITPNKEEQESHRLVAERGYGSVLSNTPGDRVRNKIAKCSPQIKAVRTHWGSENSVHWVLDVTLREDECRIRRGEAAENLATLRHFALNLLKAEKTTKRGTKQKLLKAGWDDDYRARYCLDDRFLCSYPDP